MPQPIIPPSGISKIMVIVIYPIIRVPHAFPRLDNQRGRAVTGHIRTREEENLLSTRRIEIHRLRIDQQGMA